MEKATKFLGIALISLFYYIGTGLFNVDSFRIFSFCENETNAPKTTNYSEFLTTQKGHTLRHSNYFYAFCDTEPSTLKYIYNSFSAVVSTNQQFLLNDLAKYKVNSRYLPIRFQKTDIIFPFHNFW